MHTPRFLTNTLGRIAALRLLLCVVGAGAAVVRIQGAEGPAANMDPSALAAARTLLSDVREVVEDKYYPSAKITPAFTARCREAEQALSAASSINEAYALIADALSSLDPRIRLYPPDRSTRVDYGWEWQIIGDAPYVTQVDREGDSSRQGLKRGDRIVSFEGIPLQRDNAQLVYYAMYTLAPRAGLRIQVQTPGGEPRWIAINATLRPQRKTRTIGAGASTRLERVYTKEEHRRFDEFLDPKNHVRLIGTTAVWQAHELRRDSSAVAQGLKLVQDAAHLVLDLRGQYVTDHEPALRLLNGLFKESFEAGVIRKEGFDDKLRVNGGNRSFSGTVLVLVDFQTGGYAEILARVIQLRQRGVIIGDRTMGRAFAEFRSGVARGSFFSFSVGGVSLPEGEVLLSDGTSVDGQGVAPDYRLLPSPADLAERQDVVLSQALAMLKETISPSDAYQLFPHYEDIDDDHDLSF